MMEIMTAPGYFGDGYDMPIVGMTIQNEEVLDFSVGYENLQNRLRKPIERLWMAAVFILPVMMAHCTIIAVRYRSSRQEKTR